MNKQQDKAQEISNAASKVRMSAETMAKLQSNPKEGLKELGIDVGQAQAEVYFNDDKTVYFVIPVNSSSALEDESLANLSAAKGCSGTAGTAGTAVTVSTFLTCLGSASSIATVGTAASR